ncbi:MAG: hypothetical protein Fur002_19460 [Anaerolineales bacterium]
MTQTAPEMIHKLVETFEQNLDSYRSSKNETELRREFLDKFFTALGWDVANEKGYDELGKEVIHEFSVDVAGAQKKADYAFRAGRGDKFDFLVEAKKPSVKIETSQDAAFQIRRYGWSAKLPINILTDFEHFAVYDCRAKPSINDKASVGRILLIHYKDYVSRWDEIAAIFSPEAVRKGSFAKYADSTKGKKGTADVDDDFLREIERWRDMLAKNIALRNEEIDIDGLNYAVQMIIDRVVFLRICEERGIEPENQLLDLVADHRKDSSVAALPQNDKSAALPQNDTGLYAELCELFKRADTKYNSGLFHFKQEKGQSSRADDLTLSLTIDDKVLKDIISNLYYPKSPYAFLYIPADILGQVYERFLGKVIRLTAGHQAKVEEKPEVRKAGGVYYTPTYIVEYIVKNTVGKLLGAHVGVESLPTFEAKSGDVRADAKSGDVRADAKSGDFAIHTPAEAAKLKILDPACGSGTFLLGAYQFLLDWHLNWYTANNPEKWEKNKTIVKIENGYRLSTAKKKEILLNNIYGVDIDAQAVEVTKLSLLLKVLENASGQLTLGMERVLPDLGSNIKCGNSLIGYDYFEGQLLPDEEERARVNPFDWEREFPQVFQTSSQTSEFLKNSEVSGRGGFDAVIGNPPYGTLIESRQLDYFSKTYKHQDYQKDFYLLFLEKYHNLLRDEGLLGVIISNTWLQSITLRNIRQYLTSFYSWIKLLHLPEKVFRAVVDTNVLIFQKRSNGIQDDDEIPVEFMMGKKVFQKHTLAGKFIPRNGDVINIVANPQAQVLFQKILVNSVELQNLFSVYNGIKPFEIGKGNPPQTEKIAKEQPYVVEGKKPSKDKNWKPLLRGSLIHRYRNLWNFDYWVLYGEWLAAPRNPSIFEESKKVMVRQTGDSIIATIVEVGFVARNNMHIILQKSEHYKLEYLLGLMNSSFMDFAYSFINPEKGEALAEIKKKHVEKLPIRAINFADPAEKAQHDKMVTLVEQMLASHKSLAAAQSPSAKERLERQIESTDREIDALVYQLYGLTEEEIKIVEGK